MDFVDVAGLRIGFRRRGAGTPLVLLHGAVCDSRVWRVELESFADAFTVVAWDAPGCGGSADPPSDFRMGDFASALAGLLDALALGPAHVLGHLWGSTLALELYLRHPSAVRSLVLVGAYAGWAGSLLASEVEQRLRFALDVAGLGPDSFEPSSMRGLFSDAMPPERAQELAAIMRETRPVVICRPLLAISGTARPSTVQARSARRAEARHHTHEADDEVRAANPSMCPSRHRPSAWPSKKRRTSAPKVSADSR